MKRKIKNLKNLKFYQFQFIKLLDSTRAVIFFSSINDVVLISAHEILHHDLRIEQSSTAALSYKFSLLIFFICLFDFIKIYRILKNFNPIQYLILKKNIVKFRYLKKITKKIFKKKKKRFEDLEEFHEKKWSTISA